VRILVLSTAIPFPPTSGGKLRTFHLLRALARRYELTLVGFTYGEVTDEPAFPVRVVSVPWLPPPLYRQMHDADPVLAQSAADRLANDAAAPWCVNWVESKAFDDAIRALKPEGFDLVLLEGTPMARFLDHLPPEMIKILDFMDVYSRMGQKQVEERQGAARESAGREANRTRRFEQQAAMQCNLCLAVSDDEAAAARELLNVDHLEVVPNGVDTAYFAPSGDEPDPCSLLFTGTMSYRPNAEAVSDFVRQVLPLIVEKLPNAKLHVVGVAPPKEIQSLASPHVVIHGFVPDMRPYHRRAAVVVVPLRRGGGTKLKVLEAAAMGKAVVSTTVGIEGLPFCPDRDVLVANSPSQFAEAVVCLASNRSQQQTLGARARQVVLAHDWDHIGDRLCQIVDGLEPMRRCERIASHA
jgi:sugar transferase (PEP-CTERM/EpsH1 system associated)